jgi:Arabinose efflux permease
MLVERVAPPVAAAVPGEGKQYPSLPSATAILICCMLGYAFSLLDRQILALMVDLVKSDLQLTDFQLGLCQGLAFAIFYSLLTVPFGLLADRVVRKRLLAAGVVFWSIATAACGLATGFWSLFFARMCVGIGEAVLIPSAYSMLADSFNRRRLVPALAIFGFAGLSGAGLAMLIGGLVVDWVTHADGLPLGLSQVEPWRVVFGIVGLPGVALGIIFLMLPEPTRKDLMRDEAGAVQRVSVRQTLTFLWRRKRIYLPLFAAPVLLGTIIYGAISWFPAFLLRNFGLSYTEVGLYAGAVQIGGALLGAALGPAVARYFVNRGYLDAHLRALLFIAAATVFPAVVAPLLTSFPLMLVTWALAQILLGGYLGVSMAGLQLRTPNQMRALNSALCMCLAALIGAGFGAPFVGAVADYVFQDDLALGYGLSILSGIFGPSAVLLMWWGLKAHREDDLRFEDDEETAAREQY